MVAYILGSSAEAWAEMEGWNRPLPTRARTSAILTIKNLRRVLIISFSSCPSLYLITPTRSARWSDGQNDCSTTTKSLQGDLNRAQSHPLIVLEGIHRNKIKRIPKERVQATKNVKEKRIRGLWIVDWETFPRGECRERGKERRAGRWNWCWLNDESCLRIKVTFCNFFAERM